MLPRCLAVALIAVSLAGCVKRPVQTIMVAPAFDLPDLQGGRVRRDDLKGKVVILDFWATWCGPCIREIPDYREFVARNQSKGVEVIGVVFDSGEPSEIVSFIREHSITYRQLIGTDETMDAFGGSLGFPTTYVMDAQGRIISKIIGSPPGKFEVLQKAVDEALGGRSAA